MLGAFVEIVRVVDPADGLVIGTEPAVPKLNSGESPAALDGPLLISAVSATLPMNPPPGATVIVEVLPMVAPGAEMVTVVPLTVNPGTIGTFTAKVCITPGAGA